MDKRLPRKLAAILYADVAGYSRLTGSDEDATHKTLSKYLDLFTDVVKSYNGQVMHYAGDAVLAKFEAVIDALSSAVDIQAQLAQQNENLPYDRRIFFRIGVNLGDVIEDRGDIYGDGVNIAARLESLADPGGICVSDAVRSAVNTKLDLHYEEMGDQALKNIETRVRTYRVRVDSVSPVSLANENNVATPALREFPLPNRPSIAILPFKSLGSDANQEYLTDGIRLGIQASLVQLSGLFIVDYPALNAYRDSDIDAKSVGDELEVRYILEGAVQQAGDRIRITVQLIDTRPNKIIWAERFDRKIEDVFELQDEITREVISSLGINLLENEAGRIWISGLGSPEAREFYYRGFHFLNKETKQDVGEARHMFEELHRTQPNSVIGPSNISFTHWLDVFFHWAESSSDSINQAEYWANKAMEYKENDGIGHAVSGYFQLLNGKYEDALTTCATGVELRSSCPLAYGLLGYVRNYCGDPRAAVANIREALNLERVYPSWLINFLASAYRDCGEIELSIFAAKESIRLDPDDNDALIILCSDYALASDYERAQSTASQIINNDPSFSLTKYAATQPYKDPAALNRVISALREAGLPE